MGHVSEEHLHLMLDDKKEMLKTLESIQQLCPKPKRSRTMAPKPRKLSSSQQHAHLALAQAESTPRGRSQRGKSDAKSEDAVKVLIKVWLEVRSSILSQNDAYSGISQENIVQISWFLPRRMKRVKPFSP
jgi:hypothetical protein